MRGIMHRLTASASTITVVILNPFIVGSPFRSFSLLIKYDLLFCKLLYHNSLYDMSKCFNYLQEDILLTSLVGLFTKQPTYHTNPGITSALTICHCCLFISLAADLFTFASTGMTAKNRIAPVFRCFDIEVQPIAVTFVSRVSEPPYLFRQ